ncbi:MAG: hypothetical protein GY715_16525 [Planctomycetes bacterium]|nr:hypothetical protein [Planctomycetota bacterium]
MIGAAIAVGLPLVAIALLGVWIRRKMHVMATATARCAVCRVVHETHDVRCRRCGADLRETGLASPDAGAAPRWLRAWMIWTLMMPLLGAGGYAMASALEYVTGPSDDLWRYRHAASSAALSGPSSGAYGAVYISSERRGDVVTPSMPLPSGFAIVVLEYPEERALASLRIVQVDGDATRRIETADGPAFSAESLARWMMRTVPGLSHTDALNEAGDIFAMLTVLDDPHESERVREAVRVEGYAIVSGATRDVRRLPPGPERERMLAELAKKRARANKAYHTGIAPRHFRSWTRDRGYHDSGSSPVASAWRLRFALATTLVVWLAGSMVLLLGPRLTGAAIRRVLRAFRRPTSPPPASRRRSAPPPPTS